VQRNGLRTIAVGTGRTNQLELPYLPINADVRQGDLLVTSGLGGTFPPGYPVASVSTISRRAGEAFPHVLATPQAHLDRVREVLLVWTMSPLQVLQAQEKARSEERVAPAPTAPTPAAQDAAPAGAPPAGATPKPAAQDSAPASAPPAGAKPKPAAPDRRGAAGAAAPKPPAARNPQRPGAAGGGAR
jgi:rod shape-determining protein MreC